MLCDRHSVCDSDMGMQDKVDPIKVARSACELKQSKREWTRRIILQLCIVANPRAFGALEERSSPASNHHSIRAIEIYKFLFQSIRDKAES